MISPADVAFCHPAPHAMLLKNAHACSACMHANVALHACHHVSTHAACHACTHVTASPRPSIHQHAAKHTLSFRFTVPSICWHSYALLPHYHQLMPLPNYDCKQHSIHWLPQYIYNCFQCILPYTADSGSQASSPLLHLCIFIYLYSYRSAR